VTEAGDATQTQAAIGKKVSWQKIKQIPFTKEK
jgi:hypothetical protein